MIDKIKIRRVESVHTPGRYPTIEESKVQAEKCKEALDELKAEMGEIKFNNYAKEAIRRTKQTNTVEDMMENSAKMLYYYIIYQEEDFNYHGE